MDFTYRYECAYTHYPSSVQTRHNTTHFKAAILYLGLCVSYSRHPQRGELCILQLVRTQLRSMI